MPPSQCPTGVYWWSKAQMKGSGMNAFYFFRKSIWRVEDSTAFLFHRWTELWRFVCNTVRDWVCCHLWNTVKFCLYKFNFCSAILSWSNETCSCSIHNNGNLYPVYMWWRMRKKNYSCHLILLKKTHKDKRVANTFPWVVRVLVNSCLICPFTSFLLLCFYSFLSWMLPSSCTNPWKIFSWQQKTAAIFNHVKRMLCNAYEAPCSSVHLHQWSNQRKLCVTFIWNNTRQCLMPSLLSVTATWGKHKVVPTPSWAKKQDTRLKGPVGDDWTLNSLLPSLSRRTSFLHRIHLIP